MDGIKEFPVNAHYPRLILRETFRQNVRIHHYEISTDFADATSKRADFTAIGCAAFDTFGRCYVVELQHGKWLKEESVNRMLEMYKRYKPRRVLVERSPLTSGLMPYIKEMALKMKVHLPIVIVPRGTGDRKLQRISASLQPWYINKELIFLADLGQPYQFLLRELRQMPKPKHDDILDMLSDFFYLKTLPDRREQRRDASVEAWKQSEQYEHSRTTAAFQRNLDVAFNYIANIDRGEQRQREVHHYYKITGGF
jgi:phage terminase large subunit-like protein